MLGYVSGLCRPVWACFFFSAFLLPVCSPSCVEGLVFSHPGLPLSWIRSQLAHTGPTGRVCCFAGVVSLPGCQNRTQRHTGASLVFLPRTSFTPPPKGGGTGFWFIFGVSGSPWQLPVATAGHSWLNRAGLGLCWCRSPTRPPKSHTGATQGRVWFHRLFLVRFFCGSPANCRSRW